MAALALLAGCATTDAAEVHSYLLTHTAGGRSEMEMRLPSGMDCQLIRARSVQDLMAQPGMHRLEAEALMTCSNQPTGEWLGAALLARHKDSGLVVEARFRTLSACRHWAAEFVSADAQIVQECARRAWRH